MDLGPAVPARVHAPARTRANIAQIVKLALYSRDELQELRADTGIEYDAAHARHPALLHRPGGVRCRGGGDGGR